MRKCSAFLVVLFFCYAANGQQTEVPVVSFEALESRLHYDNDTLYIVNFWATWCKPCVEELPYIEQLGWEYRDQPVKILLVSLDFKSQLTTKLIPFITENKICSEVILLHDLDADGWIPRVSAQWDGAIPVTLFYRGDERKVCLQNFESYSELKTLVSQFL